MLYLIAGLIVLLALVMGGVWIGGGIGIGAIIALWATKGFITTMDIAATQSWSFSRSFILAAIPLFIFMGEIVSRSGMISQLFTAFVRVTRGVLPGGLLQPVLLGTIMFAACTGSSTASSAAFSSSTYPELKKRRYDDALSTGVIAAGGTLGILIPPSIAFILLGVLTEVSIAKLFIGGVFPGLMLGALFMVYVGIRAKLSPKLVSGGLVLDMIGEETKSVRKSILSGLLNLLPFTALIAMIMGSIYGGLATPTEAAAVAVVIVTVMAAGYRKLTKRLLWESAEATIRITAMIYFIVFAAKLFSAGLAFSGLVSQIREGVAAIGNPLLVLLMAVVLYLIMGCVFDPISCMLITVPFVFPALITAGYNGIFIDVVVCILIEIALLTPPVGFNLFVLQGSTGVSLTTVIKGSLPFVGIALLALVLLYLFPDIVLWLPNTMH